MRSKQSLTEPGLAALAKHLREAAGKTKAEVAREIGVAPPSVFNAEECPELSLTKLRIRIIEKYSAYRVVGPVFLLEKK